VDVKVDVGRRRRRRRRRRRSRRRRRRRRCRISTARDEPHCQGDRHHAVAAIKDVRGTGGTHRRTRSGARRAAPVQRRAARSVEAGQAEIEDLRTKLGMSSLNSSLPPSRDDAAAKGKRRDKAKSARHARRREKESRRKNRSNCTLLPPDKVTSSQESYPTHCGDCGTPLRARHRLAEPERTQKYDLDDDHRLLVHEIRIYSGACPCCHATTKGPRPPEANTTKVGLLLLVRFHLSRRDVMAFLSEIRGVSLSLGLLSKIEKQCTKQLAEPYQEALEATQSAPALACRRDELVVRWNPRMAMDCHHWVRRPLSHR
jgi:hypothetical protein